LRPTPHIAKKFGLSFLEILARLLFPSLRPLPSGQVPAFSLRPPLALLRLRFLRGVSLWKFLGSAASLEIELAAKPKLPAMESRSIAQRYD
jgi:hypothetical protein